MLTGLIKFCTFLAFCLSDPLKAPGSFYEMNLSNHRHEKYDWDAPKISN